MTDKKAKDEFLEKHFGEGYADINALETAPLETEYFVAKIMTCSHCEKNFLEAVEVPGKLVLWIWDCARVTVAYSVCEECLGDGSYPDEQAAEARKNILKTNPALQELFLKFSAIKTSPKEMAVAALAAELELGKYMEKLITAMKNIGEEHAEVPTN